MHRILWVFLPLLLLACMPTQNPRVVQLEQVPDFGSADNPEVVDFCEDNEDSVLCDGSNIALVGATSEEYVNLDEFTTQNKPILMYFHASWCPPCTFVTPIVAGVEVDYKEDVIVLWINSDETADKATSYLAGYKEDFPNIGENLFVEGYATASPAFGVVGLPTIVLLDSLGNEVYRHVGVPSEDVLRDQVTRQNR